MADPLSIAKTLFNLGKGRALDKPKRGLVDEPGSYAGEGITVTEVNKYRKQGLTAKEIIKKLSESLDRNVNLSEYEKFLTANKSKLVKVIPQKITKERKKFLGGGN